MSRTSPTGWVDSMSAEDWALWIAHSNWVRTYHSRRDRTRKVVDETVAPEAKKAVSAAAPRRKRQGDT